MKSVDAFFNEIKNIDNNEQFCFLDINVASINEIENATNKSDLIILDISVILAIGFGSMNTRDFYIRNRQSHSFYSDVWDVVNRSTKPIFLLAFTSDLHVENFGLERNLYLGILNRVNAICWSFHDFPFDPDVDPIKYGSCFLATSNSSGRKVYDTWKEVVDTIPIKITLLHCLSHQEMRVKASSKKWEFSVPGASYVTRKIAKDSGKTLGLTMPDYSAMFRWLINAPYQLYSRLTTKAFSAKLYQRISSNLFRYVISRSEVSFACGSELKYFVRKFLEIPAEFTAMVAVPTVGFRDYGFIDGTHFLGTEPEEAGTKAKYLIDNRNYSDKLVQNAWNLVTEKHSASERVTQILSCIKAFQKGKLRTARFYRGDFEILS